MLTQRLITALRRLTGISFLSSFMFFSTYLVLNSVLYSLYGNSYLLSFGKTGLLVNSTVENKPLVFLTSWFSFAEMVHYNISVPNALWTSVTDKSLNFPIPAITIVLADVVQHYRPSWLEIKIQSVDIPAFFPIVVYSFSALSTYTVSLINWSKYGYPVSGISIVALCFLVTYLIVALRVAKGRLRTLSVEKKFVIFMVYLIPFAFVFSLGLLAMTGYIGNQNHLIGFVIYFFYMIIAVLVCKVLRDHSKSTNVGSKSV